MGEVLRSFFERKHTGTAPLLWVDMGPMPTGGTVVIDPQGDRWTVTSAYMSTDTAVVLVTPNLLMTFLAKSKLNPEPGPHPEPKPDEEESSRSTLLGVILAFPLVIFCLPFVTFHHMVKLSVSRKAREEEGRSLRQAYFLDFLLLGSVLTIWAFIAQLARSLWQRMT